MYQSSFAFNNLSFIRGTFFRIVNDIYRAISPVSPVRKERNRGAVTKFRVTSAHEKRTKKTHAHTVEKRGATNGIIIHSNMIFHSRISVSWVWAVLGRGCLMRSRHCRISIMIDHANQDHTDDQSADDEDQLPINWNQR